MHSGAFLYTRGRFATLMAVDVPESWLSKIFWVGKSTLPLFTNADHFLVTAEPEQERRTMQATPTQPQWGPGLFFQQLGRTTCSNFVLQLHQKKPTKLRDSWRGSRRWVAQLQPITTSIPIYSSGKNQPRLEWKNFRLVNDCDIAWLVQETEKLISDPDPGISATPTKENARWGLCMSRMSRNSESFSGCFFDFFSRDEKNYNTWMVMPWLLNPDARRYFNVMIVGPKDSAYESKLFRSIVSVPC